MGFVLLGMTIVLATITYQFVQFWMLPGDSSAAVPRTIFYEVKAHMPAATIARELEKEGVVSSSRLFYWYGRLTGKSKRFKAGDYRFTTKMTPEEVLAIIMSGISYGIPFTVPEGFNIKQIAETFEKLRPGSGDRFLELCESPEFIATLNLAALNLNPQPSTLEGFLYPDTYLISRKTTVEEVIRQMVRKFSSVFTSVHERAKSLGLTPYQALTLASIIEKETGAPQERPMISSVFHNRLRKKMPLQSDPTVIYGIKNYDGNLHRSDLLRPSPYNTYTLPGLPVGPIANPGKDAIMAALSPIESNYLYFVSHNDGTHEFTSTYEEHRKAVAKFQLDAKAREGKSWRDLHGKKSAAGDAGAVQ